MGCLLCGSDVEPQMRSYTIEYKDLETVVDLPGLFCSNSDCGEGMIEESAWDQVAKIKAELKANYLGVMAPDHIREIRVNLKLSQRRAGQIFGGGPNAFQKYETGKVTISQPMNNLLRLVSKYPELMVELRR
ncbi:type II toxin-antitoxin system MqsA family antitoxin [Sneathiella marina]|uniref:Type II toxin-antitoxin system MqsA family antitoxin n=1 Tax=Sneathiella marina TaxID=2950108 RepID=A0ABY4W665_9PROT|nr:type II toxin-antitoxin system MqsA family antitoxin [Sneathiella marina]USG61613.1 type II toxin-antitoxin system MqsA family antitoxin [Sneathiella marina]